MPIGDALENNVAAPGRRMLHETVAGAKGTSPGLSTLWGNLHYGACLVRGWGWEAEEVKTGSLAVFSDICKFGPHRVSPFLSCSTLPGSVSPNFPMFSTSPSSVSTRLWRECILGWALPLALASMCRCVVGALGVVCGSSEWKLLFSYWNMGLVWGLLRFFQTQCTV